MGEVILLRSISEMISPKPPLLPFIMVKPVAAFVERHPTASSTSAMGKETRVEEDDDSNKKCKKFACAFQYCLAKHNHDIDRCRYLYDEYERCCRRGGAATTNGAGAATATTR